MAEEEEKAELMESNTFPQDILMEILSWVPANYLVSSFKFVSKAWCSLIHDSVFVKMHLSRAGERKTVIWKPSIYDGLYQLNSSVDLDDLSSMPADKKMDLGFVEDLSCDDFDYDDYVYDFFYDSCSRLFGSCNGLLCLSINFDENIILLNPCTRKYKVSPREQIECFSDHVTFGFGCCDDLEYKVVRIANFSIDDRGKVFHFQIDIYSMSSNSWRRWRGDIPFYKIHKYDFHGVFLNGGFHWMGAKHGVGSSLNMIVSFNIRDEEFILMELPCVVIEPFFSLLNVRGCLGGVHYTYYYELYNAKRMPIEMEIWVMKEYGIKESWIKEFVIRTSDSDPPRELSGFSYTGFCITCSLAGHQIIIQKRVSFEDQLQSLNRRLRTYRRRIVLYDINKKKIDGDVIMEEVMDPNYGSYNLDLVGYNETLVSLKSLTFPLSNDRNRRRPTEDTIEHLQLVDSYRRCYINYGL